MTLTSACQQILYQLESLLADISSEDYSKPSVVLNGSTIGQHIRHTLEFFICFEQGFDRGVINYDKRNHDKVIEEDKFVALNTLRRVQKFVADVPVNKSLSLEVSYDVSSQAATAVQTNAHRELVYNIEHAVHHMAIIKIGMREVAPYVSLPRDFGIAVSTVRYHELVAGKIS
jgi:hypothetical protein